MRGGRVVKRGGAEGVCVGASSRWGPDLRVEEGVSVVGMEMGKGGGHT